MRVKHVFAETLEGSVRDLEKYRVIAYRIENTKEETKVKNKSLTHPERRSPEGSELV